MQTSTASLIAAAPITAQEISEAQFRHCLQRQQLGFMEEELVTQMTERAQILFGPLPGAGQRFYALSNRGFFTAPATAQALRLEVQTDPVVMSAEAGGILASLHVLNQMRTMNPDHWRSHQRLLNFAEQHPERTKIIVFEERVPPLPSYPNAITARRLTAEEIRPTMRRLFGDEDEAAHIVRLVFEKLQALIPGYQRGSCSCYALANDGFYMAPDLPIAENVNVPGKQARVTMSGDTVGVLACFLVLQELHAQDATFEGQLHRVESFLRQHIDRDFILDALH
jgi:hypothetical protein